MSEALQEKPVGIPKVTTPECVLLNPVEIITAWDMLFIALRMSGLYGNDMQIVRLLTDAAAGKVQCWILKTRTDDDRPNLVGLILTKIFGHPYSNEKALTVVHAHVADAYMAVEGWTRIFRVLVRYGKREGCTYFEVYSENPRVTALIGKFGFEPIHAYRRAI